MLSRIQPSRPDRALARFVDSVRAYVPVEGEAHRVERLPDGTMSLIFRVLEDGRRGDLGVVGPRTSALFKTAPSIPLCVVVQFRPGGAGPVLGVRASDLTDRVVFLEDVWGAEATSLRERLLAARGLTDTVS